jgi:hypothetical protein
MPCMRLLSTEQTIADSVSDTIDAADELVSYSILGS